MALQLLTPGDPSLLRKCRIPCLAPFLHFQLPLELELASTCHARMHHPGHAKRLRPD